MPVFVADRTGVKATRTNRGRRTARNGQRGERRRRIGPRVDDAGGGSGSGNDSCEPDKVINPVWEKEREEIVNGRPLKAGRWP